ncbi:MAG: YqgE/AlgH family protein [Stellaceae bacterium]
MARTQVWRLWQSQIAAIILAAAMLLGLPTAGRSADASLAGQLLIAAPYMGDPRFVQTVILLLRQDGSGAFGIILNRPVDEKSISSLLEAAGDHEKGIEGSLKIFAGGPVQPELGFVVHTPDYHDPATLKVGGAVAMTADKQILRDIGHHKGPKKVLFAFGYAGWGPGQLEAEIAHNNWFTTPGDPKLIFDDNRGNLWDEAMARRTREL